VTTLIYPTSLSMSFFEWRRREEKSSLQLSRSQNSIFNSFFYSIQPTRVLSGIFRYLKICACEYVYKCMCIYIHKRIYMCIVTLISLSQESEKIRER